MAPGADRGLPVRLLAVMIAAVGAGSGVFHAFATPAARVFDELPIVCFEGAFIWFYGRGVLGWSLPTTVAAVVSVFGMTAGLRAAPPVLNGSLPYLPALAMTAILGLVDRRRDAGERTMPLADALSVFAVAVFFRSIDVRMCELVPVGTHFTWHLLTALTLFLATRTLVARFFAGGLPRRPFW